ncbi:hypothetical protein MKX01_003766 [Papaver californicum]|nr:hypothetical protein MKX01_003766 [Papaver californicum]
MIQKKLGKTFVLAYPCYFNHRCIGHVVAQFEKSGFNITDYIASDPVVAMTVEGDNIVEKVIELTSKKELPLWDVTGERRFMPASRRNENDFDVPKSKKVVFILPTGKIYGPRDQVEAVLKHDESYEIKKDFKDNFFMENMCVFLIKPLAFQERCAGEILDAIESNSSNAWLTDSDSSSEIAGDEYGVAVVAYGIKSCFTRIKIKPGNTKKINHHNDEFEIEIGCEPGQGPQGVLEAAKEFFKYGFSVWAYPPDNCLLFGCIFEASLVGLKLLQYLSFYRFTLVNLSEERRFLFWECQTRSRTLFS